MTFDPNIGRWLEEDPTDFTAGDPNLYRYVHNSPTNATDPSGLREFMLEFYGVPKKTRELDGEKVMYALCIVKYNSIWFWDDSYTPEYIKFSKGCIGLNSLRLNGPNWTRSWSLSGTKAYNNLESALADQKARAAKLGDQRDERVVLYAIQHSNNELKKTAIKPGTKEYDL